MPTDLPPDYKPQPVQPGDGKAPPGVTPPPEGEDVKGPPTGPGRGVPDRGADVVDPPGWKQPPGQPAVDPVGVPTPAGTPTF